MNIKLTPCPRVHQAEARRLYLTAFPKEERAPFFFLMARARRGKGRLLAALDGERFAGLAYIVTLDDMAYLFYLAVEEELRGQGAGGQIISALKELYPQSRIFLSREQLDENAENLPQRIARREFYLKNGFCDMGACVQEAKMTYDVMGIGGKVSPQEYDRLMTSWSGRLMRFFFTMRLFYSDEGR